MWVYAPDYKEILRLQRSLRKQEIEFITPEQAHHIYTDYTVVPVAKVTGTNIEIYHSDPKKYELVRREDIINEFKSLWGKLGGRLSNQYDTRNHYNNHSCI